MAEDIKTVDCFLIHAGRPKCEEDDKYLTYVKEAVISKYFDFDKYYWLSPEGKYNIIRDHQVDIKSAQRMEDKTAMVKYLIAKRTYIIDKLEEEHEFLMSIKDENINEYIDRVQFQNRFADVEFGPKLSNYGYDIEREKKMLEEEKRLQKQYYKELLKSNLIHIIISLVATLLLFVVISDKISIGFIAPCILAVGYSFYERVKIKSFLRKGNSVQ